MRITPAVFIPIDDDIKLDIEGKSVNIFSVGDGVYTSFFEVEKESYSHVDFWWKVYAEVGYRFSPSILLLASVGDHFCNIYKKNNMMNMRGIYEM